jgi:hypothetical protein
MLPGRRVVEHSFAWLARFRRFARDDERLLETLADLHMVAFVILLPRAAELAVTARHPAYRYGSRHLPEIEAASPARSSLPATPLVDPAHGLDARVRIDPAEVGTE